MSAAHLKAVERVDAAAQAVGALEAQAAIAAIAAGTLNTEHAWLKFVELAAALQGWRNAACRAFVLELAKRTAAA